MTAAELQRPRKLERNRRIEEIIDTGDFHVVSGVAVYVLPAPEDANVARFAVAATKKVGKAVERNTVKRRMREILRDVLAGAGPIDAVTMAVAKEAVETPFHRLKQEIHRALESLGAELNN